MKDKKELKPIEIKYNLLVCRQAGCDKYKKPSLSVRANSGDSLRDTLTIERGCVECILGKGKTRDLLTIA